MWIHKPVLLQEVLSYVAIYPEGVYVDATVGLGGHAEAILEHTGPHSKLIGIDRDKEALEISRKRLERFGNRVHLIHGTFSELRKSITQAGFSKVNAIFFDLGVSSLQLEHAERGFSFQKNGPLDMRMDRQQKVKAADIINALSEGELEKILKSHAQEKYARRIARRIVRERKERRIDSTADLVKVVESSVPGIYRKSAIHPAARTFQALRMEVNEEMKQLRETLNVVAESLLDEGRMSVISFHSGEDRLVKEYIFNQSRGCTCPPHLPFCVCGKKPQMKRITKKPIRPDTREIEQNARARSARMRVAEKIA